MAIDFKEIFKEHKKIILGTLGIIVMALLLGFMASNGESFFSVSDKLTGGGVDEIVNNGTSTKTVYSSEPSMQLNSALDYTAIIYTNYGQIDVDLYESDTPKTVNNFVFLANDDFYDGLIFHRVVRDFVIQAEDPSGNGSGGPGYKFVDEIDADALGLDDLMISDATYLRSFYSTAEISANADKSVKEFYESKGYSYTSGYGTHGFEPYVIAMANSGPNTNGSQFFITSGGFTGDYLDGKHTVFGKVTAGYDVIDKIESVNVDADSKPTADVVIKDIAIKTK